MIKIKTVNKGAELVSIDLDGEEKLHDGENYWNRHSPILFPIVGKLKDGKTLINGKEFFMGQHGFARDMDFEKIGENSYLLKSNEETHKKYPFDFELYVSYEVFDNSVKTKYKVINKSDRDMLFGLGGHPAFVCDYSSGKYVLEFEQNEENIEFYKLENGLVKQEKEDFSKYFKNNKIYLDQNIFNEDSITMKNVKSEKVFLLKGNKKILEFYFPNFKYLAIWSKPGASFLCLEPWFNTADKVNSNGIFEEKEDIIKLQQNGIFESEYIVTFNT